MIDPASSLNIHGKTNVNKFLCAQQCETLERDTVNIKMTTDGEVVKLDNAFLELDIHDFDCGIKQMTEEFRELLLADKYPQLKMYLNKIVPIAGSRDYNAEITINLAGERSTYTIPVQVHFDDKTLICSGKSQVSFVDFNLEPPVKFMGLVKVNEMLDISFNLIIRKLI
ncbi:MAG: hypothetical protein P8X57_08540 [Cyclobacteriaceae bacterium]